MSRQPLSNADYALLRFDLPEHWMINTALLTFEDRMSRDELESALNRSMLAQLRFRQRVVRPNYPRGKAYWEDDENFEIKRQITTIRTPLPANQALLVGIISRLMGVGLDPTLPLWQIYLIENYGNGSALVMRLHHSLADGASLVNVLLSLTQESPERLDAKIPVSEPVRDSGSYPIENGHEPGTMQILGKLAETGLRFLNDVEGFQDTLRLGGSTANALKGLVLNPTESENNFRGKVGKEKRATWSTSIDLNHLRLICRLYGSSINDLVLSAAAGALRKYNLEKNSSNQPPEIHCLVPVDMRRESRFAQVRSLTGIDSQDDLGNQVGATLLKLPLDIADPIERLEAIHQSMDLLKASGEALATYGLIGFLGAVPPEMQDLATRFWLSKSSAVMTNVIGPNKQLFIGSAAIDTLIGWVPMIGPLGLGISFFSYNGKFWVGVATDAGLIPDPEIIVEYFLTEIQILSQLSGS